MFSIFCSLQRDSDKLYKLDYNALLISGNVSYTTDTMEFNNDGNGKKSPEKNTSKTVGQSIHFWGTVMSLVSM